MHIRESNHFKVVFLEISEDWEGPSQNNEWLKYEFSSAKITTNLNGCICVFSNHEDCLSKQLPHLLGIKLWKMTFRVNIGMISYMMQYHLLLLGAFINLFMCREMNWQNCREGQHLTSDKNLFFWTGSQKN